MRIYIIIIICHVSKSSLFHNIAKYPICRYFLCAMLGDSFDKMILLYKITQIHRFFIDVFALNGSIEIVLRDYD